jgi:predicted nucleotidyltransferase
MQRAHTLEYIQYFAAETMTKPPPADPILTRFRAALARTYGERLERAVVFGSRARGDARQDSDYDIAVFLREPESF